MGWVHLDSSVFRAARYIEEQQLLDLEFRSGAIHRYFKFPPHQYSEFMAADSRGRYFNEYIRDRFREERLRPPRRKQG
jgi:KTSC domain